MFSSHIKYLPKRKGERYASKLTKMNLSNSVINRIGVKDIKDYISNFRKKNKY